MSKSWFSTEILPAGWKALRGKDCLEVLNGFPADSNLFVESGEGIPLVRIRDINSEKTELCYYGEYPKVYELATGDLLVGMDGDFNIARWKGGRALLNQRVCKITSQTMDIRFIYYLLPHPLKMINNQKVLTTVKHLSSFDITETTIPVPPLPIQHRIADYLDAKTSEIDLRVSLLEKKRDAYTRLKKSIINRAVTRGLNPDVPLKNSQVDWIGQIPMHWEVKRLLETASNEINSFIDGDWIESQDISDEGIRYLTSGNVGSIVYKEQGEGYITEEKFLELNCHEVFPGDILISRLNPPIGRCCIVPDLGLRIVTCVDNVIYRPDKELYNRRFMVYLMNCHYYSEWLTMQGRGATMKRVSRTALAKVKLIIPPLSEQQAIADYLDKKCAEIDVAIENMDKQIDACKRLKRSLINEVITGKRAV